MMKSERRQRLPSPVTDSGRNGVLSGSKSKSHETNCTLWGLSGVLRPPPKSGKVGKLTRCPRHSWF